jgi:5-methyltetrahydropteroyltriglutamate--homocysteine methyltransferase
MSPRRPASSKPASRSTRKAGDNHANPGLLLPTTSVGSLPKPDYLKKARADFDAGRLKRADLHNLELQATRECIEMQERLGVDILVDGEMDRGDMTTFFAERMEGFGISGLVRSYGNRYYRKPVVRGPVRRKDPWTLEMYEYACSLTQKPVKGILTGPYTMTDWSFDEHYGSREKLIMAMAEEIHDEVADLAKAGARYIQVDEPALSTRPEEIDLAIKAMGVVTDGVKAHFITHVCYGAFEKIYPRMLDMPVHQFDLEMANSDYDLLDLFRRHPYTKEIGLGVVDVHTHNVESVEQAEAGIRRALEVLRPEQIYVDPDCGLKTREWGEAEAKLRVVVEAARRVRSTLKSARADAR